MQAEQGAEVAPAPATPLPEDTIGHSAQRFAIDASRAGSAWLRLVQAEAALARASMLRLLLAGVLVLLAVFFVWLSACVTLASALMAMSLPVPLALFVVLLANVVVLALLIRAMLGWSRALGFPKSRAALLSLFGTRKP